MFSHDIKPLVNCSPNLKFSITKQKCQLIEVCHYICFIKLGVHYNNFQKGGYGHDQRVYPACQIFTQVEVFKDQTEMFSLQLSQKVNSVNQHLLVWEQMRQFYIRKSQTIRIIWPILDSISWFLLLFKESPKWMLTESNIKREEFNIKNS